MQRCRRISFENLTATVSASYWAGRPISPTTSDKRSSRSGNRRKPLLPDFNPCQRPIPVSTYSPATVQPLAVIAQLAQLYFG